MNVQVDQARSHDFTFLQRPGDVRRFVRLGLLVRLRGNRDYDLARVSFAYARPAVRTFVHRLAAQYRSACGEKLVVTSLTRPRTRQPANASSRSVHPTGMALDLRRSRRRACRSWLERVLRSLEDKGVLEATREHHPPHYHVAVFPEPYLRYVDRLVAARSERSGTHRVHRGENLWRIARRHGTSVTAIKRLNDLRSNEIHPGQVLRIPASHGAGGR